MPSAVASLTLAATLGLAPSVPTAQATPLTSRLDRAIDRALAEHRIVGTVVLVAKDGKVVYHRAAGDADREAHRPMREDSLFRLSSLTKALVSTAALAMVERHQLDLDDPVTKWIPTFKPKLADGTTPVITVRHLVTHTAGLSYGFMESPDGPYHHAQVSDGLDAPGLAMEENLRRITSVPLSYAPGTRWGYSVATDVLGEVLARAAGVPLPQVVERFVTRPLGLKDTGFQVRDVPRLAAAYANATPEPVRMGEEHVVAFGPSGVRYAPGRVFDPRSFASGGAGMVGTATDFMKFLEVLRQGGGKVLTESTTRRMMVPQTAPETESLGPGWGFGLGVGVLVDPAKAHSPQPVGTVQWIGAYGHTWFIDPTNHLTVVALTNTAIEGMAGQFPNDIRDALYDAKP
ncbi:serine hydrolase [Corallococcus sp. H22C18031201]|nr:serine hydrolase [Corallococcus sp. H22C18031201]